MSDRQASVHAIYRYPVKGLSAEPLPRTRLAPGKTIPADRRYAIENGPSGFDPAAPSYLPKIRFLMLMRNERLARLDTRYDDATHALTIAESGRERARGNLSTAEGRGAIETFFAGFCADELRGPPRVLQADGHSFSDVARKVVSIINLASVAAVEDAVGAPVEAGAQDDDLLGPPAERIGEAIVDVPGPDRDRAPGAGPVAVDEGPRHGGADPRQPRQTKRPPEA